VQKQLSGARLGDCHTRLSVGTRKCFFRLGLRELSAASLYVCATDFFANYAPHARAKQRVNALRSAANGTFPACSRRLHRARPRAVNRTVDRAKGRVKFSTSLPK
jgi:hypothetical protein